MFPSLAHVRVVLLAGGKGERFWPMSTPERPKQFLRLYSDRSMLRATYERVAGLVPASHIYVITGTGYVQMTCEELPELPPENLIAEPEGRNTAPALGLAAVWLERVNPVRVHTARSHRDGAEWLPHPQSSGVRGEAGPGNRRALPGER